MFHKDSNKLETMDPEIFGIIENERARQEDGLELIASENYTSPAVMQAQGSILTNKYAEGLPNKRYYGGCEFVDLAEILAIKRVTKLFNAKFANVQPHSGSQANMGAYFSMLEVWRQSFRNESRRRWTSHSRLSGKFFGKTF